MRALFFLLSTALLARDLAACQCGRRPSPTEAMGRAVAVFDGTVIRRTPVLVPSQGVLTLVDEFEFVVHQTWLGPGDTHQVLRQGFSNCDSGFVVGKRYLVFTEVGIPNDPPTSSICLPTQPFATAAPALAELGPGFSLVSDTPVRAESTWQVNVRHVRASFLAGIAVLRESARRPREAIGEFGVCLAPLVLASAGVAVFCVHCLRRRRARLLLLSLLPLIALLALSFVLGGYLYMRTNGFFWRFIDYLPGGV
jgi:hypothetical protein